MNYIGDFTRLSMDAQSLRNSELAIAAYRASGNRADLEVRNPLFVDAVRRFRLAHGDFTDDELEL